MTIVTGPKTSSAYAREALDRAGDEEKQTCRDRVGEYLLEHHEAFRLSLLSFPSQAWSFERQIDHAVQGRARFLGIERVAAIVHKGMGWMPGSVPPRWFMHEMADGRNIHGVRTDRSAILNMDAESFLRTGRHETGARTARRIWADSYKRSTAVWLDFCAQISSPIEIALPALGCCCDMLIDSIPVAISVLKAREDEAITERIYARGEGRAGYLAALLNSSKFRRFVLDDSFEYTSGTGSPFLTVLGRLINRSKGIPHPRPGILAGLVQHIPTAAEFAEGGADHD